ncbi:MAG: CPBP family intramembrane metalloprotease [Coriobacteriia bacterium]|nr:CPBP family intramembrane metalloprotease [Coriobacteriia bacterium]
MTLLVALAFFLLWKFLAPFVIYGAVGATQVVFPGQDRSFYEFALEIASQLSFVILILLPMLYVKLVERRSLGDLGFSRPRALRHYGAGLLVGLVSFGAVFALALATGAVSSASLNPTVFVGGLVILFVGYMVQSMGEETLARGLLCGSVAARYPRIFAIALSSVFFSVTHGMNSGISLVAMVNITIVGVALALMYLVTRNLWVCGGFHCAWNFVQGPLFGISVSGNPTDPTTLLISEVGSGSSLLTGGTFGLEGSLLTTGVLLIVVVGFAWYAVRTSKQQTEASAQE